MIFAAGLGTRLKPLTNDKPKALVTVNGTTLLELTINKLIQHGFNEIIINIHYFGNQIIDFLKSKNNFNISITISDESELLLDTGGGLKKTAYFFNDNKPFLVHNVDIVSEINLTELYAQHLQSDAIATLAVKNRKSSRYFIFDENLFLCGWKNEKTGETVSANNNKPTFNLAFSGIHVLSPEIFNFIKDEGVFSITNSYLKIAATEKIKAYSHDDAFWMDAGTPESIKTLSERL